MYLNCKHCHDQYDIGSGVTRQLLLTYCTEQCAIADGVSTLDAHTQFEERVPVRQQPAQPLNELEELRQENAQLKANKQLLWNSLHSVVRIVEMHEPESEYRKSVLSEAYKVLWPAIVKGE